MDFSAISWLGVVLGAIAFFLVGGLWYGPLFGKAWMRAAGVTEEQAQGSPLPLIFAGTLLLSFLAGVPLAAIIGAGPSVSLGLWIGALVGLLIAGTTLAVQALYEQRPLTLLALGVGYNVLGFMAMGAVIAAFQ